MDVCADVLVPTAHAFDPERIPLFDIADDNPPLCHGPVSEGLPQG